MARQPRDSGQASVELIAAIPALALVTLLVAQLALAGYALWSAGVAARAGARAAYVGGDAGRAALASLPPALRDDASVRAGGSRGAARLGAQPGRRPGRRRAADRAPSAALADRDDRPAPRAQLLGVGAEAHGRMSARATLGDAGNGGPGDCASLLLATDVGEAKGGLAVAAAIAVALAVEEPRRTFGVLLAELGD